MGQLSARYLYYRAGGRVLLHPDAISRADDRSDGALIFSGDARLPGGDRAHDAPGDAAGHRARRRSLLPGPGKYTAAHPDLGVRDHGDLRVGDHRELDGRLLQSVSAPLY